MPNSLRILLITLLLVLSFSIAKAQFIITYAGDGYNGNIGNGNPALCAGIPYTRGVSFDGKNAIYLTCSNSIRKINIATGIISNVSGSDTYGYAGDGGPAANALLQSPFDVCADSVNNIIYIAEYGGNRIRKIDITTGIISTIAGNGSAGYSGDGGPAINASLNKPMAVCLDYKGNLYIADMYNSRTRKIDLATGIISTYAGNGNTFYSGDGGQAAAAGTPYPNKICSDLSGNIYISEVASGITSRIRKINAATGIITTIAGNNNYAYGGDGGPAVNATLFDPAGVFVDKQNNVYISEYDDSRVRKIDAATGIINTLAGNGTNGFSGDGGLAASAALHYPLGLTMDNSNNLYVADNTNHRIRQISFGATAPPSGVTVTIAASGTNGCTSNPITFTASITNGGLSPVYQWQINGVTTGTNSNVYTASGFSNGDVITCTVTTTICAVPVTAISNSITLLGQPVVPSVTISTPVPRICIGAPATFTAIPVNCGVAPTYQWKINGTNVATGSSFTSTTIANGDRISCVVTVDPTNTCASSSTATSNEIIMEVAPSLAGTVHIDAPVTNFCGAGTVVVNATLNGAGSNYTLEWILNGTKIATNVLSVTLTNLTGVNNKLYCILTTVRSACYTLPYYSDTLTLNIFDLPVLTILPADTTVNPGGNVVFTTAAVPANSIASYTWQPATQLINPQVISPQTVALFQTTPFTLNCITNDGCAVSAAATVKVFRQLYMPNTFTPNNDTKNDVFRIPPGATINLVSFIIYDRWGEKVFVTTDKNIGWDGTIGGRKKDQGIYVYVITMIEKNVPVEIKGSFMLVR
jgi:gliding motility-associated-like protein